MRITKIINTFRINIVQNAFKVNKKYVYTIVEKNDKKTRESLKKSYQAPASPHSASRAYK